MDMRDGRQRRLSPRNRLAGLGRQRHEGGTRIIRRRRNTTTLYFAMLAAISRRHSLFMYRTFILPPTSTMRPLEGVEQNHDSAPASLLRRALRPPEIALATTARSGDFRRMPPRSMKPFSSAMKNEFRP